ncbi:hypothetical protein [Robinsoniella sp. KNHs210]
MAGVNFKTHSKACLI